MKVFEINQQIAEKRKSAEAIVTRAVNEDRDMSQEENDLFAQFQAAIATLTDLAAKMQSVDAEEDQAAPPDEAASAPPARKSKPIAFEGRSPAVHTEKRTFSICKAVNQVLKHGHLVDGLERE